MPRISPDFKPTEQTVKSLIAWGSRPQRIKLYKKWFEAQNWLKGELRLNEEFIVDHYNITSFVCFWMDDEQSGKYEQNKSNWQTAYQTDIKKKWCIQCLEYESTDRHHRSDTGSNGFTEQIAAMGQLMSPEPLAKPQRRYKLPERPSIEEIERQFENKRGLK